MSKFRRKIVAVIGGANGIGLEISRLLAQAGARVVIGDRDADAAIRAAEELPGETLALAVDVTSPDSLAAFSSGISEQWGAIDTVINSAGVMSVGPFAAESDSATRAQLDVNLYGAINVVKAVAPGMRERGSGHIIVIASAASVLPTPGEATYSASKHGVFGYFKAVRSELRSSGVNVSVVMPTVVDTALAAGTSAGAAELLQPVDVAREVLKTMLRPRFEVPIPDYLGPARRAIELLPVKMRDAVYRKLVPDQVQSVDPGARAAYEARQLADEN